MPKYTYICNKCSKETSLICSFSEKEEHEEKLRCHECNSEDIRQTFRLNIVSDMSSGENGGSQSYGGCCGGGCGCG